jgi:hypothetical protein
MYTVISYETAEFEICMWAERGSRARAMYHARRRARYWEQEITCFRILGEGLSYESAMALLRAAQPWEGVKVMP